MNKPNNPFLVSIGEGYGAYSEITLRDLFAGFALNALLVIVDARDSAEATARIPANAYKWADTMLEARGKQQ